MGKILFLVLLVSFSFILRTGAQNVLPLKVSADKRYLTDQRNTPFPILGRTAWFIISQPENGYGTFVENTLQHGYNSIEFAAITHWPIGNHAPFNGEGERPFIKRLNGEDWNGTLKYDSLQHGNDMPDLLSPNEKYWTFLDRFIAYCESKGMVIFMFPAYIGYEGQEQGWMKELVANGGDRCEAYGSWIAGRYRHHKNIVWMLLGDMGNLSPAQQTVEAALIKGLKRADGQSVQYTAESHSGENAADNVQFGHEMTINGVYTWELKTPVPYLGRKGYSHSPVMPAFLLEEPYDEEGPDGNNYNPNATQPVRRFQWWGWLSTIGGYISGNGYVWQFVDPVWQQHLNTQGATDMGRLNGFIKSLEWWTLVPSGLSGMKELVPDDANADTTAHYVASAAARDGSLLVAYIPPAHSGPVKIDMTAMRGNAYGYWFDPTSGSYRLVAGSPLKNSGVRELMPPGKNSRGENDWVLLLSLSPGR